MPVYGCPETPDAKTGRCARHPRDPQEERADASAYAGDPDIRCEVCRSPDDDAKMLLCGDEFGHGCDKAYHMSCLTPPLTAIPPQSWFCPSCQQQPKTGADAKRHDAVVLRRTRKQTAEARQLQDTWEVERLTKTRVDAEVGSGHFSLQSNSTTPGAAARVTDIADMMTVRREQRVLD